MAAAVLCAAVAGFLYYHPDLAATAGHLAEQAGRLVLFAMLAWTAYYVGRLCVRRALKVAKPDWEAEWAAGFMACGLLALGLGALGLLYGWIVRAIVVILFLVSSPTLLILMKGRIASPRPAKNPDAAPWALWGAVAPFAVAVVARAFAPPADWDALAYHLYIPKMYASNHGLVYMPRLVYASMPLGGDIMFTWAYAWNGLSSAQLVSPLFSGLLLVAAWRCARRFMTPFWSSVAVVVLALTPVVGYFLPVSYVDLILAAFAVMALNVYLGGMTGRRDPLWAGLLLGAGMGVKYTGIYAVIALAPLVAHDAYKKRLTAPAGWMLFAGAALPVLPWLAKAWVERGNPFFPAFYGLFGGRDLSPAAAAAMTHWQREIGRGRALLDYLALPWRASIESGPGYRNFDGMMLPWSLLIWALAWIWFRRPRLLIFTGVYFAAWACIGSQQLRFLSAFYATTAVITAGLLAALTDRVAGWRRGAARAAVLVPVLFFGYTACGSWLPYASDAWYYMTSGDAEQVLLSSNPYHRATKYVNENLPADAAVLLVFHNQLLYMERRAIYDSFFEASETLLPLEKMTAATHVDSYIRSLGTTHIVAWKGSYDSYWKYYRPATRGLWESYLADYTKVLAAAPDFEIRKVGTER